MQLMKFVCSFAWADLEVHPNERDFVARIVKRLDLGVDERRQVDRWLELPPSPDEIDPTLVPTAHRKTFVDTIVGIIESDGVVSDEERDSLALFEHLLP
ncbi:MAG TPA: TerB family tellurite resistance protein [Myxococcales bacterium]|nr:TerB family tellurite resistance protein [Myxococcales bacterium]HIM02254.1 TerB family tellurite resistance protein [Myxococcales bacterium]